MKIVLLAENHLPTRGHLAELLAQAGYQVEEAADPLTALERLATTRPDAVAVSADFPPLEGEPFSVRARATPWGARVPIIVIDRGHLGRPLGVKAVLGFQANGYVLDPLKPGELLPKLSGSSAGLPEWEVPDPPGAAALLAEPAAAAGELRTQNLPVLARQIFQGKRSGVLVVSRGLHLRRLFIKEGAVARFDSNRRAEWLTQGLLDQGVLSQAQWDSVLVALGQGTGLAQAAAGAGLALPAEALEQKVAELTRERTAQLFTVREGRYAFHVGDSGPSAPELRLPLPPLIFAGVRRAFPLKDFLRLLRPHLTQYPYRTPAFARDLAALALSSADLRVAMQVNGRLRLRELLTHGRGDLHLNTGLLWFLTLMGHLAFEDEPRASDLSERDAGPERIIPRKRKPFPEEEAVRLKEAALHVLAGSYFHALGVSITAVPEEIERAFEESSARFHPDSHPEFDLSGLEGLLESVQDKLSASRRVLGDPDKKVAYLAHLLQRMSTGRLGEPHAAAEVVLRQGDEALARGEALAASSLYEAAAEMNPKEPEYHTRLAFAAFVSTGGDERVKAAQRHLKRALALDPESVRAQVLMAVTERAEGQLDRARKRLLDVLSKHPGSALARAALRRCGA